MACSVILISSHRLSTAQANILTYLRQILSDLEDRRGAQPALPAPTSAMGGVGAGSRGFRRPRAGMAPHRRTKPRAWLKLSPAPRKIQFRATAEAGKEIS